MSDEKVFGPELLFTPFDGGDPRRVNGSDAVNLGVNVQTEVHVFCMKYLSPDVKQLLDQKIKFVKRKKEKKKKSESEEQKDSEENEKDSEENEKEEVYVVYSERDHAKMNRSHLNTRQQVRSSR